MSRLSSNRKIQNMDTQTIKLLQDILKYCQEHGHKPDHNIAYHKTLSNINHLIYTRQQKGIAIPKDIPALYAEIKQFPTAAKHRLNLQKATKKLKQESKYDKIQRLTPYDLRIMKQILGDQTFTCFINTNIDITATKAFLEYFYKTYYNITTLSNKERIFIKLHSGCYGQKYPTNIAKQEYKLDDDLVYLFNKSKDIYSQELIDKFDNNEPLTIKELNIISTLTQSRIKTIFNEINKKLFARHTNLKTILNAYLSGDTSTVLSTISSKATDMYQYQKDNKLIEIPTNTINQAGKSLLQFFLNKKSKSN